MKQCWKYIRSVFLCVCSCAGVHTHATSVPGLFVFVKGETTSLPGLLENTKEYQG